MDNTKKNIGIVLVVVAALLIGLLVFSLINRKENRTYSRVTSNLQDYRLDGDDLYFYTSSFFAKYNLQENKVDRLSDYLYVANGIYGVAWASDSVLFQTNSTEQDRDDVTTAAQNLGANAYIPHWWRYDFKLKQYQLLDFANIDDCQELIQIDSKLLGCIKTLPDDVTNQIVLFSLADKSSKVLLETNDDINGLASGADNLYYTLASLGGKESVRSIGVTSGKKQTLYSSKGIISSFIVNKDGEVLINDVPGTNRASAESEHSHATKEQSVPQKLLVFKGGESLLNKDLKAPELTLYMDKNSFFASSVGGSIWEVSSAGLEEIFGETRRSLNDGDFLFNRGGSLYVVGADGVLYSTPAPNMPRDYKPEKSFEPFKDNPDDGNSWIGNPEDSGVRSVSIYLNNIKSSVQQQSVGNNLAKEGFWPSEFNFEWIMQSEGSSVPIEPNATVIR